jgi:MT0933-like antitoxin protein
MSLLDKLKRSRSKAKQQADQVVEQHGDKIASGIEKTGEAVNKATGRRFDDKIDKGVSKAKERLEQPGDDQPAAPPPTTAAPESTPKPSASDDTGKNTGAGPTT